MNMVVWKKLGDIANITIGEFVHRDKQNPNSKFPVYNGGTSYTGFYDQYNNTGNKIVISARGYAGFVNRVLVNYWAGNSSYSIDVNDDNAIWHYVYYYLKNEQFNIMAMQQKGGGLAAISKKQIQELLIPIPSFSEQQRIVSILDTFISSIENLKEQIAQRRKQYNWFLDYAYYPDKYKLLEAAERGDVIVKTFDEIGTFTRGRRFVRTDIVSDGVPCIHYGDMYTYYGVWADKTPTHLTKDLAEKLRFASKGDVIIVGAGENDMDIGVGVAWLSEEDVVVHDACYIFKHNINPKYFSYYLRSMNYHLQIKMGVVDGKICSISAKELGRTIIPIPSISEQQRIVSILDTFEASIANLEAQLAQREKQYEYYRNKLFTFE